MSSVKRYIHRCNWLRAAVLGANDGILSTTSLVIGVAAANSSRSLLILTGLAGLVAGATSMAAGEYVSVCSQSDIEKADIEREKKDLEKMPKKKLKMLAKIYETRGLDPQLATQVAEQLSNKDALDAHVKDGLGIGKSTGPKPIEAAFASGASFIAGGMLPVLVALCAPMGAMILLQYVFAIVFLAISGATAAKLGGSSISKGIIRICFWGTVSMIFTALVGYIFGINIH